MKLIGGKFLDRQEILAGFDRMASLHPHVPSLCLWRAWEIAAYARCEMQEPVLDLGCGDGSFFRLVWPRTANATGLDQDGVAAEAARRSGVYQRVVHASAQEIPVEPMSFGTIFANCALEHMDDVARVMGSAYRSLRPGGQMLFSVVTEKFVEWNPMPALAQRVAGSAALTLANYLAYHHLTNPLPIEQWVSLLKNANFANIEHIPIIPQAMSQLFLFIDHLWHLPDGARELGFDLHARISRYQRFQNLMRSIVDEILQLGDDPAMGSGVVFRAWRPQ